MGNCSGGGDGSGTGREEGEGKMEMGGSVVVDRPRLR
jgi:hypothetical protein